MRRIQMAFFDQIGKKITDAGQGVVKQTKNLTDTTRLNAKIAENKKKMSHLLFELGNDYYKKHKNDKNCEEQAFVDQLNALFLEILQYQREIGEIKKSETCKVCGSRIAEGAAFCMNCGAKVLADAMEDTKYAANTGRKCPACGTAVDQGCLFCISCGMKLEAPADTYSDEEKHEDAVDSANVCPTCGAATEDGDVFCMNCGTRL